ncbi:MAG: hypothetical protein HYY87_03215 [Candidatus Levybacteria bacterium]|nr:hypothetical protein [Candidatus Daviesbacteria bacterium]MBI3070288.1 hypothetical protein [Candidatus Levybacteria bacterium]
MLTKSDVNQIRGVVREEVENVVTNRLKPVKKDLRHLKKTVDIIAKNYDEGDVKLNRRVKRIEHHLSL